MNFTVPPDEVGLYLPWLPRPDDATIAAVKARRLATAPRLPFRRDSSRLNIAFIGPVYHPIGGTERFHQTLLPRLAAMPDLHVIGYALSGPADGPPIPGVPVAGGGHAVRAALALADVAIVWGLDSLDTWRTPGWTPRVVAVSHGDWRNPWNIRFQHAVAGWADALVGVSNAAARAFPRDRASAVIPNGIDFATTRPTRARADIRCELGLGSDEVACLYLGRLSAEKSPALAAAAVRRLGRPFRLLLAGDGLERGAVETAGGGRARVLGHRADVGDLLAACDLLIHPSRTEGCGLAILEAMAAGVPVIASPVGHLDCPGGGELARIVPLSAGPDQWADAIAADWRESTARRQRVVLARATVEAENTADVFASRWAALVRSLAPPAPSIAPAARIAPRAVSVPRPGIVAVERLDAARACDYRQPLSVPEQSACGCGGRGAAVCLAGRSRREDQRVTLAECVSCQR
jgi:glycosyltransferase involved in cell wall biosynthesis